MRLVKLFAAALLVALGGCTSSANRDLVQAAFDGDSEKVASLLKAGASVDGYALDGWTPLTAAASKDHMNVVQVLINSGANIDLSESGGNTALFWASYGGYKDVVIYLLQHGASPSKACEKCITPYRISIVRKHPDVTAVLQIAANSQK